MAQRSTEAERVEARVAAGRPPIRATGFPDAHNLVRYRPAEVTEAILRVAG